MDTADGDAGLVPPGSHPADADYRNLRVERTGADGSVVTVTFESTTAHNSLNPRFLREYRAVATSLREVDARCVVVRGSPEVFCSGADLSSLAGDGTDAGRLRSLGTDLHAGIAALLTGPAPVVVGVEGVAAGAGFGLALAGDVVLASEGARFEFVYPRVGLTADAATTFLLPRLVGLREAQRITLLDRPVAAAEAADVGLVTEAVPADEFEDRLAGVVSRLADGPTAALARTRRLLLSSFDRCLESQLAAEADSMAAAARTDDYRRGHAAFFGDGDPAFEGR
jgi:2-(1,2-epoxy-1,2-dihydrophenyl)acetyl-CoA isomerase